AYAGEGRGGRHQRYQLVYSLAQQKDRHLILVTATPHSGNEEAFRSLLTILDRNFVQLPEDLTGREHEQDRRRLAAHFVQRRRGAAGDTETAAEADEIGRHTVLDHFDNDSGEGAGLLPGSGIEEEGNGEQKNRRRLLEMAREAEALKGSKDEKLQKAIKLV